MIRWMKTVQVIALAAGICFTMGESEAGARFENLGHRLMCACGCAQLLGECNHVGCPSSTNERKELVAAIAADKNDRDILALFSAKYGGSIKAAPHTVGFELIAWIAPFAVLKEDSMRDSGSVLKTLQGRLAVFILLALFCAPLVAQQGVDDQAVNKATLQLLLTRIDQLEARVIQLEADKQRSNTASSAPLAGAVNSSSPNPAADPSADAKAAAQPATALQVSSPEPEKDEVKRLSITIPGAF